VGNSTIDMALDAYRRKLKTKSDLELEILVKHYNVSGNDRQSRINALVEHYRQELLKGAK
jgi:hypothetical protein